MEDSSTYHIANTRETPTTSPVQLKGGSNNQEELTPYAPSLVTLTMVSPPRKKGRVSPHLFEHVFANPLAEAEAELEAEAAAAAAAASAVADPPPKQPTKARKVRQRKSAEIVDELKKTAQEVAPEEKEVFVVREPEEEQPEPRRGRGRPRGAARGRGRGRGNGHAATTQSPERPKEPTIDERLPYGFPEEGKANRPISEQSDLYLYDPDEENNIPEA
ncbi:hypothetical protein ABKA04_001914 [Annulohypoxylon sp. FPYF3050]